LGHNLPDRKGNRYCHLNDYLLNFSIMSVRNSCYQSRVPCSVFFPRYWQLL
jgi:hypothetical protein